jgi:hypothetical protein
MPGVRGAGEREDAVQPWHLRRRTVGPDELLLTDSGVRNPTIRDALVGLLGRPIDECTAVCAGQPGLASG